MQFQIFHYDGGREPVPAIRTRTKQPMIYDCPKKAAAIAARLTRVKGSKFQPKPIIDDADAWMRREARRFVTGEYKPVVWFGQDWWDNNVPFDHFVHVDVKDPNCIAYTKNRASGNKDVKVSMKPGRYLSEYFGAVLSTEQIKEAAMQHAAKHAEQELKFARTPEEIEKVYAAHGLGSCFEGTKNANLYGSGDWAVAYITDKAGKVTGRTICAPERKIYVRIYGDTTRLRKLMADEGYNYSYGGYKGLRLLAKHWWRDWYGDFENNGAIKDPNNPDYYVIQ